MSLLYSRTKPHLVNIYLKNQDSYGFGKTYVIPSGLGDSFTYMGWQLITDRSSRQYKMREQSGTKFDYPMEKSSMPLWEMKRVRAIPDVSDGDMITGTVC